MRKLDWRCLSLQQSNSTLAKTDLITANSTPPEAEKRRVPISEYRFVILSSHSLSLWPQLHLVQVIVRRLLIYVSPFIFKLRRYYFYYYKIY